MRYSREEIEDGIRLSTWEIIKIVINKWASPKIKLPVALQVPPPPSGITINHIAIVLDGRVEEVIHTENRMAALLLSEPQFVQFPDSEKMPTIGWIYKDGQFFETLEDTQNGEENQVSIN